MRRRHVANRVAALEGVQRPVVLGVTSPLFSHHTLDAGVDVQVEPRSFELVDPGAVPRLEGVETEPGLDQALPIVHPADHAGERDLFAADNLAVALLPDIAGEYSGVIPRVDEERSTQPRLELEEVLG